ncbi:unnamed protein product [Rotaria sordida]|uniref:RING-type domain-containing protein n=1 Tax=Rotaria sordida TaxID=392033 RepID=A0A815G285_9BILA|nr:unnamed protein product [Rotaria sordida]CAF1332870.1 unnamed protein product [Rotaria sordida]CAF1525241.1 unnamed protein product [Rotaria sordida]CAF4021999.1 unnamed protein product [Rotaria sordida]
MSSFVTAECPICEEPLGKNDEVVITECGHTFHRACAQERVNKKKKTDCRVCQKESALANALYQNQTTTIQKTTGQSSYSIETEENAPND